MLCYNDYNDNVLKLPYLKSLLENTTDDGSFVIIPSYGPTAIGCFKDNSLEILQKKHIMICSYDLFWSTKMVDMVKKISTSLNVEHFLGYTCQEDLGV